MGVGNDPIGIELQTYATPSAYGARLMAALRAHETVDVTIALGELRIRKSELELQCVRKAARLTNLALAAAFDCIRSGATELAIASEIQYALGRNGSEYSAMPVSVGSGPRTAGGHATPTDRVIRDGEPVAFYFAGVHKRYHVSAYKTVHVGKPSDRFLELYDAAEETLGVLAGTVKVGRPVREAALAAASNLAKHGLAEHAKMRWGYGVGVAFPPAWLEPLDIIEESTSVFAAGMVMCLHICLFLPDEKLGLLVGGDYLLREDRLEALDEFGPGLHVL
jgi:Xaa-Pro dipeptidase